MEKLQENSWPDNFRDVPILTQISYNWVRLVFFSLRGKKKTKMQGRLHLHWIHMWFTAENSYWSSSSNTWLSMTEILRVYEEISKIRQKKLIHQKWLSVARSQNCIYKFHNVWYFRKWFLSYLTWYIHMYIYIFEKITGLHNMLFSAKTVSSCHPQILDTLIERLCLVS